MKCSNCHIELMEVSHVCSQCETSINGTDVLVDGSMALDTALQPIDNMQLFVGEKYSFYEKKWNQAKDPKMFSGVNIAGIFAPFWMAYRKMYAGAIGLVIGFFVLRIILSLKKVSELDYIIIQLIFMVFISVYFMFKGNAYYYNFARKKIVNIQEKTQDRRIEGIKIEKAGGTNILASIGIWLLLSLTIAVSNVFFPAATDPVRFVKNSEFELYPDKIVGSAFEKYFSDTEWKLEETGGKQTVRFTGTALSGGNDVTVTVLFDVNMEKKELVPNGYFLDGSERSQQEFDTLMKSVLEY